MPKRNNKKTQKPKKKKISKARLLEQLVARIEKLYGPELKVTSPEKILDKNSGGKHEFDVTVRGQIGTSTYLVVIECRRRKKVDDVTWINEVAKKSQRVNANKAILVSSKGFTKPAQRVAEDEGVEVRRWKEFDDPATIAKLFPGFKFSWNRREVKIVDSEFYLIPTVDNVSGLGAGGSLRLKELSFSLTAKPETRYTWIEFIHRLNLGREDYWAQVPSKGIPGLPGPVGILSDFIFQFCPLQVTTAHRFKKYQAGFPLHLVTTDDKTKSFTLHWGEKSIYIGALYLKLAMIQELMWEKEPDRLSIYESPDGELSKSLFCDFEEGGKLYTLCMNSTPDGKASTVLYDPTDKKQLKL